ncbi:hypothetical protein PCL_10136 [Purpureocillium lilacinum]|uniref:Uncharacterized protein n=1 Tax=Purpureocillium lilacinum TaxID=33203 RepID=A0A2U3EF23_PURLI|nr:hypothetical protein PCL_10136 [Purpureocillium lilacinum]
MSVGLNGARLGGKFREPGGFSEVSAAAGRRPAGCGTRRTPAPAGRPIAAPPLPNALERLEPATPGQRARARPPHRSVCSSLKRPGATAEDPAAHVRWRSRLPVRLQALREGPAPLAVGRRTARNGRSTALTGLGGGCPLGAIGDRLPRVPCRMEWNNTPTLRPSPSLAHAASHDHPPRSSSSRPRLPLRLLACLLPSVSREHAHQSLSYRAAPSAPDHEPRLNTPSNARQDACVRCLLRVVSLMNLRVAMAPPSATLLVLRDTLSLPALCD